jgi:chorismate lyase/3-hydroxybenzoate synthase
MRPFSVHFSPAGDTAHLLDDRHVLALIEFGGAGDTREQDPRRISVGLPQLDPSPLVELWTSETPVVSGVKGRVSYSSNDQVLLGHLSVDDRDYRDVEEATREAYEDFLPFAHEMGFPHYLRIWNYIADINGDENDVERYKRFCVGRHAGLADFDLSEHMLPAASGVGCSSSGILIYFLAARDAGIQVENPRQVSAFHYPPQYGPKSPAFSRAILKDWGTGKHLYISGTASIVGHESVHADDVLAQLTESLRNVGELVRSAQTEYGLPIHTPADLSQIKVYIRNEHDYELIRRQVHEQLGEAVPVIYLRGDLCRKNLLVELEGLYAG